MSSAAQQIKTEAIYSYPAIIAMNGKSAIVIQNFVTYVTIGCQDIF